MKKLLLCLSFYVCFCSLSKAQSKEVRDAEARFVSFIAQRLNFHFDTITLANFPFKHAYYFSYQIIDKDSVNWFLYNHSRSRLMDSITRVSFNESLDSMRKAGIISLLQNEERTYIPVYIFYKTNDKDPFDDTISIEPAMTLFCWGFNEKNESETVFRITRPLVFKLPKSKPYY